MTVVVAARTEWNSWIDQARAVEILTVVKTFGANLHRNGTNEYAGPCPMCGGRDRFSVNTKKNVFNCRVCGAKGDGIDFVQVAGNVGFNEACESLTGRPRPDNSRDESAEERRERLARHAAYQAKLKEIEAERQEIDAHLKRGEDAHLRILERARPIEKTHAHANLEARGLKPKRQLLLELRYVEKLDYWGVGNNGSGEPVLLGTVPARVDVIRNVSSEIIGVSQTYLDPQKPEKWNPGGSSANSPRKIRGEKKGGMIRLGRLSETLALSEGVENALAWYQLGHGPQDVSLAAAVDLSNLSGRPLGTVPHPHKKNNEGKPRPIQNGKPNMAEPGVIIPEGVKSIIILGDADSDYCATVAAVRTATNRFLTLGYEVALHWPPVGRDWNDQLIAETQGLPAPIPERPEYTHPEGIESAQAFLERTKWIVEPPFVSRFGALYLDEIDDPGAEHDFLIHNWLSTGDKSVIAGESRAGKSFLALEIALSIAYGRPLFGLETKQGGAIYQVGEGARGAKKRLRAWRDYFRLPFSRDVPFCLLQRSIDIYKNDEQVDALIAEILAHAASFSVPLRLVVIDTLAQASIGADEISGKDMGLVMANVAKINERTGAHVCLVHHLSAAGRVRGHTSVYAACDQIILVTRDEETKVRTVKLDKQKDGDEGLELKFELVPVVLGLDERGNNVTSCVCQAVGEAEAVRREEKLKGIRLTLPCEVFVKAFFEAERLYGFPVPPEVKTDQWVRSVVFWEDVKRAYDELSPSDALTKEQMTTEELAKEEKVRSESLRRKIGRYREELTALGVIGVGRYENRTVVWHTGAPLRAFPATQPKKKDEPFWDATPF